MVSEQCAKQQRDQDSQQVARVPQSSAVLAAATSRLTHDRPCRTPTLYWGGVRGRAFSSLPHFRIFGRIYAKYMPWSPRSIILHTECDGRIELLGQRSFRKLHALPYQGDSVLHYIDAPGFPCLRHMGGLPRHRRSIQISPWSVLLFAGEATAD